MVRTKLLAAFTLVLCACSTTMAPRVEPILEPTSGGPRLDTGRGITYALARHRVATSITVKRVDTKLTKLSTDILDELLKMKEEPGARPEAHEEKAPSPRDGEPFTDERQRQLVETLERMLSVAATPEQAQSLREAKALLEEAKQDGETLAYLIQYLEGAEKADEDAEARARALLDRIVHGMRGRRERLEVTQWIHHHLGVDLCKLHESFGPSGSKTAFSIAGGTVARETEADPEAVFFVDLQTRGHVDRTLKLQMSLLGLPMSAASSVKDKTPELIAQVIKTAGSIAASFIGLGAAGAAVEAARSKPAGAETDFARFDRSEDDLAGLPSHLRETLLALLEYKRALQRVRLSVVTDLNQVPVDTLKHALTTIDAELGRVPLFFVVKKERVFSLPLPSVLPTASVSEGDKWSSVANSLTKLLEFSPTEGVRAPKGRSFHIPKALCKLLKTSKDPKARTQQETLEDKWKRVQTRVCKKENVKVPVRKREWHDLELFVEKSPDTPQYSDVVGRAGRQRGGIGAPSFHYRIPAQVTSTLRLDKGNAAADCNSASQVVARQRFGIGQLGVICALPAWVGGDIDKYSIKFHEQVSALMEIDIQTSAPDAGAVVAAVGEATNAIVAAETARKTAEAERLAAQPTEIQVLEAEKNRLELQKQIELLRRQLDAINGDPDIFIDPFDD